jgi:DNA-binding GntR family transcriptional regulator
MRTRAPSDPTKRVQRGDLAGTGRVLLKDRAYAEIKRRILDERFGAGTFLAERSLAEDLGMSKTPVGEAIARLEAEGFVAVSPQQGIVVREFSFHEVVDHFDTRIAIESHVALQLSGRLTAAQVKEGRELLEAQRRSAERRDVATYVQLDTHFHLLLSTFLANQEIVRVMAEQCDKLYRVIHRVFRQDPSRVLASHREHVAIFDAVEEGKDVQASRLVRQHLEVGKRYLVSG